MYKPYSKSFQIIKTAAKNANCDCYPPRPPHICEQKYLKSMSASKLLGSEYPPAPKHMGTPAQTSPSVSWGWQVCLTHLKCPNFGHSGGKCWHTLIGTVARLPVKPLIKTNQTAGSPEPAEQGLLYPLDFHSYLGFPWDGGGITLNGRLGSSALRLRSSSLLLPPDKAQITPGLSLVSPGL